ncbi:DUF4003 family protein [Virgibacillus sp. LDC-1]|uniref:DUF4003 family protein n=1 Tax=Virgibacillus sp. LDC-1 TaxID=3039856 RepID=UPI0024DEC0B1|nr:DUF4003 family protein [Virgibacillus sp. LDC-1]
MKLQEQLNACTLIYEELKDAFRWKVSDNKILMTIASMYVLHDKPFNLEQFKSLENAIKQHAGIFSSLRSESRFTTAAMLDVHFETGEKQVPALFELYEALLDEGFSRGIFTYLAATVLLTKAVTEEVEPRQVISKAKKIYDGMKDEHIFLTSKEDYPLAILLGFETKDSIVAQTETYYQALSESGFRKGNDLQSLSHILALGSEDDPARLVDRTVQLYDAFRNYGLKRKAMYYPAIGILALLPPEEVNMEAIVQLYESFNQKKDFKWQKDMNVFLAIAFFAKDKLTHIHLAETSIYTTLESVLQAQQIAMTTAITSAVVLSSTNNGQ